MNFSKKIITSSIPITIVIVLSLIGYAYSSSLSATTTLDTSNRRIYTYCPLSNSDINSFNGEIDGCPVVRVYISNWTSLSPTQQSTIDTLLTSKGFVDEMQNPTVK